MARSGDGMLREKIGNLRSMAWVSSAHAPLRRISAREW